jgi:multiple sugar transport system permease protein
MNGKSLKPYLFIGPHLLLFITFFLVPAGFGIYISFTRWNLRGTPTFIGFENYREILFNTASTFHIQLWNGLTNTFIFVLLTVPFCILFPLLFATALNTKPRMMKFFQSVFYLPTLFSVSAVAIIWAIMFSRAFGPINRVLGLDINWLGIQPHAWMVLVAVTVWWTIGQNMIIYQAALSSVSKDYYEAASLDGANSVQKFFCISLPSIKSQILYTLVLTTILQFNIIGQPMMITGGGPGGSTTVLLMYINEIAFGRGSPSIAGIASAMAIILGLCIMLVSFIQFRVLRFKD